MPLPSGPAYNPPITPLEIIHQDDALLLVDKPHGLLSVAGKSDDLQDCLEARVKKQFRHALLIHRLDMDTSGIMVFALSRMAQRDLNRQFETRQVEKTYLAQVWGSPATKTGQIDLPMASDWDNRPLQKVCFATGRAACTDWRVLKLKDQTAKLELRPLSGRTHQLRVHMQAIGHPILGDRFYAKGAALTASDRLDLHAFSLQFKHPESQETVSYFSKDPF